MDLFTQCIYECHTTSNVLGISVMSRHTRSNGWSEDPRIKENSHTWVPDLAPPDSLVGEWYKSQRTEHPMTEQSFTARYLEYLNQDPQKTTLDLLLDLVRITHRKPVLLCVEPRDAFCHRRLLAQRCQELEPRITVIHL